MYKTYLFILLLPILLLLSLPLHAQDKTISMGYKVEQRDTIFQEKLKEVYIFHRPKARIKSRYWRKYYRSVYNFKKTYEYALLAKEMTKKADSVLNSRSFTPREREKYLDQFQKELFKKFEKPLMGLTISQGRMLLKLIDREVGQSSYYIIKSYRGRAASGFWQGIAKLFGSDLKKPYDKFGEEKALEELVIMYHNGTFDYLYFSLFTR